MKTPRLFANCYIFPLTVSKLMSVFSGCMEFKKSLNFVLEKEDDRKGADVQLTIAE